MSQSTADQEWLPVAACARLLGSSERQARRYAGRLSDDDGREAGHGAGRVTGSVVCLSALQKLREEATGQSANGQSTAGPVLGPDTEATEVGHHVRPRPDATPVLGPDARLFEVLKRENAFLRGQIEAHVRAEAELHAALHEALKLSHRALPEGGQRTADDGDDARQMRENALQSVQMGSKRQTRPLWKVILGMR